MFICVNSCAFFLLFFLGFCQFVLRNLEAQIFLYRIVSIVSYYNFSLLRSYTQEMKCRVDKKSASASPGILRGPKKPPELLERSVHCECERRHYV